METESNRIENNPDAAANDKTVAIVAYLTFIGLIIAFVMNQEKKDAFSGFHIRQSLGLCLCGIILFVVGMVPILGWVVSFFGSFFLLYLWIMGLINAINGRYKAVPALGEKFNEWFNKI